MYLAPSISIGKMNQKLINRVWINLINLSAYKFSRKKQKLFVDYACVIFLYSINKSKSSNFVVADNNLARNSQSISGINENIEQLNILKFFLKSFCYKHSYKLLILPISFFASFLTKSSISIYLIAGLCSFFIFITSFLFYSVHFSTWYLLFDSAFRSSKKIFNNIYKRTKDFGDINSENRDEVTKKILQDIINARIFNLSDDWRLAPFYTVACGAFLSGMCLYIFSGDTLVEAIKQIANTLGFEDFKIIKDMNVENFLYYLFSVFTFLSGFAFLTGSKRMKADLIDSLHEIENRPLI